MIKRLLCKSPSIFHEAEILIYSGHRAVFDIVDVNAWLVKAHFASSAHTHASIVRSASCQAQAEILLITIYSQFLTQAFFSFVHCPRRSWTGSSADLGQWWVLQLSYWSLFPLLSSYTHHFRQHRAEFRPQFSVCSIQGRFTLSLSRSLVTIRFITEAQALCLPAYLGCRKCTESLLVTCALSFGFEVQSPSCGSSSNLEIAFIASGTNSVALRVARTMHFTTTKLTVQKSRILPGKHSLYCRISPKALHIGMRFIVPMVDHISFVAKVCAAFFVGCCIAPTSKIAILEIFIRRNSLAFGVRKALC